MFVFRKIFVYKIIFPTILKDIKNQLKHLFLQLVIYICTKDLRTIWFIARGSEGAEDFHVKSGDSSYRGCLYKGDVSTAFHWSCMNFVAILLFTQQVFYLLSFIVIISNQLSA